MITADVPTVSVVRRGEHVPLCALVALTALIVLWFLAPEYLLYIPIAGSYFSEIRSALP